ncbi:MAG: alkaline phosphatase D family protein, partial [Bacteroidota bacterium]
MVKIFLRIALALVLAIIAFAFYLAAASQEVPAGFSTNKGQVGLLNMEEDFVIAFGSCNNQRRAQDYWPVIGEKKPDVWLWLGDNIYSDTDDMQQMAADYATQQEAPAYRNFRESTPQIFGIWDDHDYGLNDGGKEWPYRDAAKNNLLDFLGISDTAAVRSRPGAYQSYTVGPKERPIKIILLDTRYFRDPVYPPVQEGHRYGPNP